MLCVSTDWLYRHARQLPFARKFGAKMLRFSYTGIQKWIAARKMP
jgi:predicted DNA-binding transcriptional regulator AlpA